MTDIKIILMDISLPVEKSEILVFKTNLYTSSDLERISPSILNEKRIIDWNVDKDDHEKILRIESFNIHPQEVISLITNAGYHCEELTD